MDVYLTADFYRLNDELPPAHNLLNDEMTHVFTDDEVPMQPAPLRTCADSEWQVF